MKRLGNACFNDVNLKIYAPVAQLDRAPDYESGGQEFESLRVRHYIRFSFLFSALFGLVNAPPL